MGRLSARPASKKCHFEKAILLKEKDPQRHLKNRKFCLGSFSSVSTNFSILSSLSGRIHPHLGPEGQNSRSIDAKLMKNRHSKCEKCNFDPFFQPRKKFQKKKFLIVSARSQRRLSPCEGIFQKFVDTDENKLTQISSTNLYFKTFPLISSLKNFKKY